MIKRTLYFGNPAYLSLNNAQLLVRLPEVEKNDMNSHSELVSESNVNALTDL